MDPLWKWDKGGKDTFYYTISLALVDQAIGSALPFKYNYLQTSKTASNGIAQAKFSSSSVEYQKIGAPLSLALVCT